MKVLCQRDWAQGISKAHSIKELDQGFSEQNKCGHSVSNFVKQMRHFLVLILVGVLATFS
jgi:hypothetical protein